MQDVYGAHAISCPRASGAIDKHNAIVNGIYDMLKGARISCIKEASNPAVDSRQRPGDIYIPDFDVYGEAYLDVSVITNVAESNTARAMRGRLECSRYRFDSKKRKYPDLGNKFKPLVLESSGGWHPYSMDYLKTIANTISARCLKTPSDVLGDLLTMSSIRLQRHQGTMLVRRCLGL